MTIHLEPLLRAASCNQPGLSELENKLRAKARRSPYLVLLPAGFTMTAHRCRQRGALLPHPFTLTPEPVRGGLLSVALIPGVAPAGRYPAPCLPGARTFLHTLPQGRVQQSSSHLARHMWPQAPSASRYCSRAPRVFRVETSTTPSILSGRKWR